MNLPTNTGAVILAAMSTASGSLLLVRDVDDHLPWMSLDGSMAWFSDDDIVKFEVLFEGVAD